ncbi:hypothetical protein MTO96_039854 [Rhipicephalus appendiculatus]
MAEVAVRRGKTRYRNPSPSSGPRIQGTVAVAPPNSRRENKPEGDAFEAVRGGAYDVLRQVDQFAPEYHMGPDHQVGAHYQVGPNYQARRGYQMGPGYQDAPDDRASEHDGVGSRFSSDCYDEPHRQGCRKCCRICVCCIFTIAAVLVPLLLILFPHFKDNVYAFIFDFNAIALELSGKRTLSPAIPTTPSTTSTTPTTTAISKQNARKKIEQDCMKASPSNYDAKDLDTLKPAPIGAQKFDETYGLGAIGDAARQQNAAVQVFLALGGFREDSADFHIVGRDPIIQQRLVQDLFNASTVYNLSGITLHWLPNHPVCEDFYGGGVPQLADFVSSVTRLVALNRPNVAFKVAALVDPQQAAEMEFLRAIRIYLNVTFFKTHHILPREGFANYCANSVPIFQSQLALLKAFFQKPLKTGSPPSNLQESLCVSFSLSLARPPRCQYRNAGACAARVSDSRVHGSVRGL